jgi:hypothetical protein
VVDVFNRVGADNVIFVWNMMGSVGGYGDIYPTLYPRRRRRLDRLRSLQPVRLQVAEDPLVRPDHQGRLRLDGRPRPRQAADAGRVRPGLPRPYVPRWPPG